MDRRKFIEYAIGGGASLLLPSSAIARVPQILKMMERYPLEPETVQYFSLAGSTGNIWAVDANIKSIKYGSGLTLSSVTANLSTVNGTAFVSNPSVDLRPYAMSPFKISLTDTASKVAYFYGKAAGTGETLDTELITNGNMELDANWAAYGVATTLQSNEQAHGGTYSWKTTCGANHAGVQGANFTVTAGALYKRSSWFYLVAPNGYIEVYNWDGAGTYFSLTEYSSQATNTWLNKIEYITQPTSGANAKQSYNSLNGYVFYVDDASYKKVLTPSATGITGTDTAGGATFNWASIEAGFNPNSATFTVTITRE